ncbi:hypothetical protein Tco_0199340 [Tanacetum coccineum]
MVRCSCGLEAVIRTSWTNQNPGHHFYGCPTLIIPGLLRSRNELEEVLAMVEEKRLKLMKYLIISWVVFGFYVYCTIHEEDTEEEALEEFSSTLDNVLENISGKSCEHFGWDWPEKDSPGTEVEWLDQPIQVAGEVVFYPPVHEDVAEEVIKMANDQAEALCDQEVTDECLDDEYVEERRPSKRIRVT